MSSSKPNIIAIVDAAWGTGETAESGEGVGQSPASSTAKQEVSRTSEKDTRMTSRGGALSKGKSKKPAGKKAVRRPPPRRP